MNMLKIAHRINTTEQLAQIPVEFGVEIDLHAFNEKLVVHHDAFTDAIEFETWLKSYKHSCLILNVKEEGIESKMIQILEKHSITNWFMLDLSFPSMIRMTKIAEKRMAVRVSQFESIETAFLLKGHANWIWLDLFSDELPLQKDEWQGLKEAGYKICLCSPELHGRNVDSINLIQSRLSQFGLNIDAVCTKHPELWS